VNKLSVRIVSRENVSIEKWREFVDQHPNGTIFQSPAMFELYERVHLYEPVLVIAFLNEEIKGLMLAVIQKEHNGLLGKFTARSLISGGPLVYENSVAGEIIKTYTDHIKGKVIYSQFRNLFDTVKFEASFSQAGYRRSDHLDIIFDLQKKEEELWSEVHVNRKKEIKNGIKKGVAISQIRLVGSDEIMIIYSLLKKLYKKIGLPLPAVEFFKSAIEIFESKGQLQTFVAKVESKIIGFRMVLLFKDLIYDWYAASDDEYLNYRPNDILPWEIMKWGAGHNYKVFDFGGAGKPDVAYGVREYKLKFGGELVNYGRYEKIHKPLLYKLGKMGISILKKKKKN
jgi:serine/alanine adding enzyme